MKKQLVFCLLYAMCFGVFAQKYVTEKSFVSFFSHATIEDIKADNKKAVGIFNSASADVAFSIPINEFQFVKSLMQEHFNEKYMESEKYPKSTFQGKISDFNGSANGEQKIKASGSLTIHGVTNAIEVPGTIEKRGEKLLMKSKFIVKLQDYKIEIPQLLWKNIAEQVEVTLEFTFKPQ
jgi:polyisoprenoid-binding protein YceI